MPPDRLFEVATPLGFVVRTTSPHWKFLQQKHPDVAGRLADVEGCLAAPAQVRRSKQDPAVYLFYTLLTPYYLCVIVKRLDGEGFVVTCYVTDTIKEGTQIWPTSE